MSTVEGHTQRMARGNSLNKVGAAAAATGTGKWAGPDGAPMRHDASKGKKGQEMGT